jgi:hypothetical protein
MRLISLLFILIASTAKAQVDDSLQVFHDQTGYITCINNGEYKATFFKSELQSLFFGSHEAVYDVKTRTLTISGYRGTYAGNGDLKLFLTDDAPLIEWNNTTARLDTSSELSMVKGGNLFQTIQISGIDFSTTFLDGLLQRIEIEFKSGQIFKIDVSKSRGNKSSYFYRISARPQNGNAGLLLAYAMDGTTPFSLLMISDKTKRATFLLSKWKWQKFQTLSVKQFSNDPLKDSSNVYHLKYNKKGKVKGKKHDFLKVSDCNS